MAETKVDLLKLDELRKQGKSQREIARFFDATESAVSQAVKRLNGGVTRNVVLESAHKVVDRNLDAMEQLQKINAIANKLLDEMEERPELRLKVMAEIRCQLRLQLEIFQSMFDMKAVQEFQIEVLDIIGKVDKGVRDEIIYRLSEKRAIRSAIQFN